MKLQEFKQFCKQSNTVQASPYCVIYYRVSSKEQEKNYSLETQRENCDYYAKRAGLQVMGYFGGKYESAKNDERKEFIRMMDFIKSSPTKIGFILVNDSTRFSRSGANAIYIASKLRESGVQIVSAKNPVDTTKAIGQFQQNMDFLFGHWDNTQRREKSIDGMVKAMQDGKLCSNAPTGYSIENVNGTQSVKPNDDARFVKMAFSLKAQGISNTDIVKKLRANGCKKMYKQLLQSILKNPFYCGVIVHSLLDEPIQGRHEPIIDKDLFLTVNGINQKGRGHIKIYDNENLPLKGFLKCAYCGTPYTGFKAKKNGKYYYRCNKTGCKCNISAEKLHESFKQELYRYTLNSILAGSLREYLLESYNELQADAFDRRTELKRTLSEIQGKIDQIEERYVLADITKDLFDKFASKYIEQRTSVEMELQSVSIKLSNPEKRIEKCMNVVTNLPKVWELSYLDQQRQLQKTVFPNGIQFAKREMSYQTQGTNIVFGVISKMPMSYDMNSLAFKGEFSHLSNSAPPLGQLSNFYEDFLELAVFAETADLTMLEEV